ncbi:hypothetical protein [Aquipuribacter sp. MA13-6]|uniref:hypothetical protein n=1 Tax=unclassified Aquipuribacter TaxID=2635084 RepID=UPI003EEB80F0
MLIEAGGAAAIVGALIALAGIGLQWRALPGRVASRQRELESLDTVAEAMGRLYGIVRHADEQPVSDEGVREAVVAFERTLEAHEALLPDVLRPVRREVRFALANWVGGPASAALSPEAGLLPSHRFDRRWWWLADSYIEYLLAAVQQSRAGRTPPRLWRYDQWPLHFDGCACPPSLANSACAS